MLFTILCLDLFIFLGIIVYAITIPLYYFIYKATGGKRKFFPWFKAMKAKGVKH